MMIEFGFAITLLETKISDIPRYFLSAFPFGHNLIVFAYIPFMLDAYYRSQDFLISILLFLPSGYLLKIFDH